jgi:four helix bundle protein
MEPIFDHEKLDVYGLELEFIAWTTDFLEEASQSPVSHRRELFDQLDRACLSVLLNTAEGNGKRQGLQRARFFDDARGSALESAACLDASVAKRMAKNDRIRRGKELLVRIVAMLTRLVERFDPDEFRARKDGSNP